MTQIKKFRVVIDEEVKKNDDALLKHEQERNESLREIGNHLHESCIVSNDEVCIKFIYSCLALSRSGSKLCGTYHLRHR